MDDNLGRRYLALLAAYDQGGSGLLAGVRRRLMPEAAEGRLLRPDAALLLVALYDAMIIRPYAGTIHLPGRADPLPLPEPRLAEPGAMARAVEESLTAILEAAQALTAERPISSHQILRAIEDRWGLLADSFLWA